MLRVGGWPRHCARHRPSEWLMIRRAPMTPPAFSPLAPAPDFVPQSLYGYGDRAALCPVRYRELCVDRGLVPLPLRPPRSPCSTLAPPVQCAHRRQPRRGRGEGTEFRVRLTAGSCPSPCLPLCACAFAWKGPRGRTACRPPCRPPAHPTTEPHTRNSLTFCQIMHTPTWHAEPPALLPGTPFQHTPPAQPRPQRRCVPAQAPERPAAPDSSLSSRRARPHTGTAPPPLVSLPFGRR